LPLLEGVGDWLEGLLPDDPENSIFDRLRPGEETGEEAGAQPEN
jgi:membrane protein required for colicin V production